MKAVVLLGGVSSWLASLSRQEPRAMLDVGNAPVLQHLLQHLSGWGVEEFLIPLPPNAGSVKRYFGDGGGLGLSIRYAPEKRYLGTAGCLHLFADELSDSSFLIVNGSSFLAFDEAPILATTSSTAPFLLVGMQEGLCRSCSKPGRSGSHSPSFSHAPVVWQDCDCTPAHVYHAHPGLLSAIPKGKYFDLREQLIPKAIASGFDVRGVELKGTINHLRSFEDYLKANLLLAKGASGRRPPKTARISKSASIIGPVIIGANAEVGPDALIVGPTVIGQGSVIGRGAVVHKSVLSEKTRVGTRSHVQKCILAEGAYVKPASHLLRTVVCSRKAKHRRNLTAPSLDEGWDLSIDGQARAWPRHPVGRAAKRALDLAVVLLFGPLIAAAVLALGLLVKLSSPGPVFFREKRLGRDGKGFIMYKLRTMFHGAHLKQNELRTSNESDGPMFKIVNDPRITPLGHWLRKTSLDELPQFWNVLRGDMSLVGPRPLADREMRWRPAWREMRLKVKPGVTGPWQAWCGSSSDFSDWIECDTYYVRHASLWLDLKLIFETLAVVFRGRRPR